MSLRNRRYELTEALTVRGMYATGERMLDKASDLADKYKKSPDAKAKLKEALVNHYKNVFKLAVSLKVEVPRHGKWFRKPKFSV